MIRRFNSLLHCAMGLDLVSSTIQKIRLNGAQELQKMDIWKHSYPLLCAMKKVQVELTKTTQRHLTGISWLSMQVQMPRTKVVELHCIVQQREDTSKSCS